MRQGPNRSRLGCALLLLALAVATALLAVLLSSEAAMASADLEIGSDDIGTEVDQPTQGATVNVTVTVRNIGSSNATGFYLKLRDVTASSDIGVLGPYNLSSGKRLALTFSWDLSGASGGSHTLKAIADSTDAVTESDETNNEATRQVTVNLPPAAVAASNVSFAKTHMPITFNASQSSDQDGTIKSYLWYFGDGKVGTGLVTAHSYADGGPSPGLTYNVTLVATDEDGGVGKSTIHVRIYNRPPTASAEGTTVLTKTKVSLSGSASSDTDGKITRYRWTLHNGTVKDGSTVVVSYPDDGEYGLSLQVWDDDGATDSTYIVVKVNNRAPTPVVRVNRTIVALGDPISFDGSGSSDLDGVITDYSWIFGDGSTATGSAVVHSYSVNGSYNVTLVLADDDGAVSYKTVHVIVGNRPPVAVVQASSAYVLTYVNVTFNASASVDPDGNVAAYSWDFGDGHSANGAITSHNFTDDGTYDVTLTVTDTGGAYGTATLAIVVGNRPPKVAFGDLVVMTGEAAVFNASLCGDLDGYLASFRWDCGEGAVYTTANASHTWKVPGVNVISLTVWDDDGASNITTFNVTVLNRAPRADMVAQPVETTLSLPVEFNGSASSDPDGTVVNWTWNFGDGARAYGPVVAHLYNAYGTYFATLTVRDNNGGVNSTGRTITVQNQPPTATFNITPERALTGELVSFDARDSYDPENQIKEYFWSFGDGASEKGAVVSHRYADDGRFVVRLTVVDEDGTSAYAEHYVIIANRLPLASASVDPDEVWTHERVTLDGTNSSDPDGSILWYRWDFGDGSEAYGSVVTHTFSDDGSYNVTLKVTDNDGDEARTHLTVTVMNQAPVAEAGQGTSTQSGVPVRLDGRGSYDPDGTVASHLWDFGDGSQDSGAVVTHAFLRPGTYVVNLTVIDDDGLTDVDELTVVVVNVPPVARISGDSSVKSGEEMEFAGTESFDLDGEIYEYNWDFGDGSTSAGPIVHHTYERVGAYTVTLTVKDQYGLQGQVDAVVHVLNRLPVALASSDKLKLATRETVTLDGTGSSDPDGDIESYTWILGDGSVSYGPVVTHVYADDGIYMVVLTVKDDGDGTDSTSLFIQVENRPPEPALDAPDEVDSLVEFELLGNGSVDPDGTIASYFWDFGDGTGGTGPSTTHSYSSAGDYSVRLTVMDDDGRTAMTNVTIVVRNKSPIVEAEVASEGLVNSTVKFDSTMSSDPDGIIIEWLWEFGDGGVGEGREVYHRYIETGEFQWNLTVVDDKGASVELNGTVLIQPEPPEPGPEPGGQGDGDSQDESPGLGILAAALAISLAAVLMARGRDARFR